MSVDPGAFFIFDRFSTHSSRRSVQSKNSSLFSSSDSWMTHFSALFQSVGYHKVVLLLLFCVRYGCIKLRAKSNRANFYEQNIVQY